mmetsp:Transcript_3924/g.8652  ORF Transcript_3924/g.8652 Transcript_3924/m.8652 type:complete len:298 (-) Transcript_3924:678-1571(-)
MMAFTDYFRYIFLLYYSKRGKSPHENTAPLAFATLALRSIFPIITTLLTLCRIHLKSRPTLLHPLLILLRISILLLLPKLQPGSCRCQYERDTNGAHDTQQEVWAHTLPQGETAPSAIPFFDGFPCHGQESCEATEIPPNHLAGIVGMAKEAKNTSRDERILPSEGLANRFVHVAKRTEQESQQGPNDGQSHRALQCGDQSTSHQPTTARHAHPLAHSTGNQQRGHHAKVQKRTADEEGGALPSTPLLLRALFDPFSHGAESRQEDLAVEQEEIEPRSVEEEAEGVECREGCREEGS